MELTIRNMVCDRCKAAVAQVLDAHHLAVKHLDLGRVQLVRKPTPEQLDALQHALRLAGFELVNDRDAVTVERIKAAIVQLVHHSGEPGTVKLSDHLSGLLHKEYSGLSALFRGSEGTTIEQYFLLQRLERVKELIMYGELSMAEIADRTGFSSAAHLSAQFRKLTGITPTLFKRSGAERAPLDRIGARR